MFVGVLENELAHRQAKQKLPSCISSPNCLCTCPSATFASFSLLGLRPLCEAETAWGEVAPDQFKRVDVLARMSTTLEEPTPTTS